MAAPTQADREGFAALAARVLVTRGVVSSAEPRLSAFALDVATDSGARTIHLHDAMAEALGAPPEERTAVITACARWHLGHASGATWDEVRAHVRPVLRNAWFGTDGTVSEPAGVDDHLGVFVAFRVPREGLRYVTDADLAEWGVDEAEVLRTARENLHRHLTGTDLSLQVVDGVELMISAPGLEASSLALMLPRVVPVLRASGGHPVVAIPERDVLLSRRAQPGTLPFVQDAALERFGSSAQALSPIVLACGEGGTAARASLESLPAFAVAKRRLLLETYAAQGRILRSRSNEDEIPEPEERIGDLVCTWNEGTHALLPEVASVKLVPRKGSRTVSLEWYAVRSLIGSTFQQEPDLFPPRWRAFPWKRDDVRDFGDDEEDEKPDPEMEAHFAQEEAEWGYDEGSGDEEARDYDEYEGWQEGDPDITCPFCGSGLRGEKVCEVCGRSPAEANAAIKASVAPTHAIRLLQALVDGKHLELANTRGLPAIGRAISETLDGSSDWAAQAATLSARLLSMNEVSEIFLDDAALADLLARTAGGPSTPDAALAAKMSEVERAEAEKLAGAAGAVLVRKILRHMCSSGALEPHDEALLDEAETPLAARIAGLTDAATISRAVFTYCQRFFGGDLIAEKAEELLEDVQAALGEMVPAAPPAAPEPVAQEKPDAPKLPAARRLMRRLLDEGHVEMVAGGSQELVENAIAQLLASDDADDPALLHALLDEMDEDVVLFADAETLAKLPKR